MPTKRSTVIDVRRECAGAAAGGRSRIRSHGIRTLRTWIHLVAIGLFALTTTAATPGLSNPATSDQMQGLDVQVQEIKTDVLRIAAELNQLEEKLLYPSNTQVAFFVSLSKGESIQIDSVRIHVGGEPVTHHVYSFKEVEALQKGGVQRVYTGNLAAGEYKMDVSVAGKTGGGGDFEATESFTFSKGVEPRLVGITLAGTEFGGARIQIGNW